MPCSGVETGVDIENPPDFPNFGSPTGNLKRTTAVCELTSTSQPLDLDLDVEMPAGHGGAGNAHTARSFSAVRDFVWLRNKNLIDSLLSYL